MSKQESKQLVLEAGKTYVFKNEECKRMYLENEYNESMHKSYYKDGFTLNSVTENGTGFISGWGVIGREETKFFKLKEATSKSMVDQIKDLPDLSIIWELNVNVGVKYGDYIFLSSRVVHIDHCLYLNEENQLHVYKYKGEQLLDKIWEFITKYSRAELSKEDFRKELTCIKTLKKPQESIKIGSEVCSRITFEKVFNMTIEEALDKIQQAESTYKEFWI